MQMISKFNKWFQFLLCIIGNYSQYAWVFPLKDEKGFTITNAFQKKKHEHNRKSNKIWSTHNEGKSVFARRFTRAIKNKIYNYITLVLKHVYIDKLVDMINK